MDVFINLAGPAVVLGGLYVMLFGRPRAIEIYFGILAAIGVVILWAAALSSYSPAAGAAFTFGLGLLLIGGMALLLNRVVVPAE